MRPKPVRMPRVDENQFLIAVIRAAETPMNGVQWCECVWERVYMWRLLRGGSKKPRGSRVLARNYSHLTWERGRPPMARPSGGVSGVKHPSVGFLSPHARRQNGIVSSTSPLITRVHACFSFFLFLFFTEILRSESFWRQAELFTAAN